MMGLTKPRGGAAPSHLQTQCLCVGFEKERICFRASLHGSKERGVVGLGHVGSPICKHNACMHQNKLAQLKEAGGGGGGGSRVGRNTMLAIMALNKNSYAVEQCSHHVFKKVSYASETSLHGLKTPICKRNARVMGVKRLWEKQRHQSRSVLSLGLDAVTCMQPCMRPTALRCLHFMLLGLAICDWRGRSPLVVYSHICMYVCIHPSPPTPPRPPSPQPAHPPPRPHTQSELRNLIPSS